MATTYGAPFAETASSRLHGNVFGKGRATRSTDVVVFNKSNKSFKLDSHDCDHGGYSTDLFPVHEIQGKESTVYGMESHGFLTGVECTVKYTSRDGSYFEITANNPYIGSNSMRQSHSSSLRLTPTKGQGDNNQVRWIIEDN